jgi:hypothetical protein
MHPNCEFIGLALPCAGVLRRRAVTAAGAEARLQMDFNSNADGIPF